MNDVTHRTAEPPDAPCIGVPGMQVLLDTCAPEATCPAAAREGVQNPGRSLLHSAVEIAGNHGAAAVRQDPKRGYAQLGASTRAFEVEGFGRRVLVEALVHDNRPRVG